MIEAVLWDFDGVLNRNIVDGRFLWAETFDTDIGDLRDFQAAIFGTNYDAILTGQEDLRDRVAAWTERNGYAPGPDALLRYWFDKDALLDPETLAWVDQLRARGVPQGIATNNEVRRATYLSETLGMTDRVGPMFASGPLGLRKPDPAFFDRVAELMDLPPATLLLVDDLLPNVEAAQSAGWQAFHFTDQTRDSLVDHLPL